MKKILGLMVVGLLVSGLAGAEDKAYIGLGWVNGGASPYTVTDENGTVVREGTIDISENSKVNLFAGWQTQILEPLPLYIGAEFLIGIKQIGEDSQTSLYYTEELYYNGNQNYEWKTYISEDSLIIKYFDLDFSPRIVSSLYIGPLTGTAYIGLNFNRIQQDWERKIDGTVVNSGTYTVAEADPQFITGIRLSAFFVYAEYTRYFNFKGQDEVDFNSIAENRISLGLQLTF